MALLYFHTDFAYLQGCGNPVCVVLDRKPRRFRSLCHFVSYVAAQNRKNQVNFIQKGDCYDISKYNNNADI